MPTSRIIAEGMLIDLRSLVISMGCIAFALQQKSQKTRNHAEQLLESVKEDLGTLNADHYQFDDVISQYKLSFKLSDLQELYEELVRKVNLSIVEANARKLRAKIEEKIPEPLSEVLA